MSYESLKFNWENGFFIKTTLKNNSFVISANKEGLLSLANHLTALADDGIHNFHHFYLDETNSLEENSEQIIFEKVP